uniref:Uncharacterized protein n=1 Tax=Mustela putorius furo TaxID=9669 RepID=M3YF47_MUSPF
DRDWDNHTETPRETGPDGGRRRPGPPDPSCGLPRDTPSAGGPKQSEGLTDFAGGLPGLLGGQLGVGAAQGLHTRGPLGRESHDTVTRGFPENACGPRTGGQGCG